MKEAPNIMVLSSWEFDEPLTKSYLLPNVRIMRETISKDSRLLLQTSEKKKLTLDEKKEIREFLMNEGVHWIPIRNRKFNVISLFILPLQILQLIWVVKKSKVHYLHPFAPGAGALAWMIHLFTRIKIVMDSWEPHADAMVETGVWPQNGLAFRLMFWTEKKIYFHSTYLIAASKRMKDYGELRFGKTTRSILYRPASINLQNFDSTRFDKNSVRQSMGLSNKCVCACVSKLGGLYLKEDAIRFFRIGLEVMGPDFHVLLISANNKEEISSLCEAHSFPLQSMTHLFVRHDEIPRLLSVCQFAFNPQFPVPSKRYGTPVKDGEYWAMGLPIMLFPDISDDSDIVAREHAGIIIQDLSDDAFRIAFEEMKKFLEQEKIPSNRIRQIAQIHRSEEFARTAYNQIYNSVH